MSMLEARYFVAKISDAQAVLCDEELATLERLIRNDHACVENGQPCHWLRVNRVEGIGVCSSCPDALNQFASTSQEQATGQDDYRNSPEWKDFSSRIGNALCGGRSKAK